MLLALALHASTARAGTPAGFSGTPGVINENTPHYDLEPLYHDGKAQLGVGAGAPASRPARGDGATPRGRHRRVRRARPHRHRDQAGRRYVVSERSPHTRPRSPRGEQPVASLAIRGRSRGGPSRAASRTDRPRPCP